MNQVHDNAVEQRGNASVGPQGIGEDTKKSIREEHERALKGARAQSWWAKYPYAVGLPVGLVPVVVYWIVAASMHGSIGFRVFLLGPIVAAPLGGLCSSLVALRLAADPRSPKHEPPAMRVLNARVVFIFTTIMLLLLCSLVVVVRVLGLVLPTMPLP